MQTRTDQSTPASDGLDLVAQQVQPLRFGGLNWCLNSSVKVQLTYDHTTFTGGTSPLLKDDEHVLFTRAQFSW